MSCLPSASCSHCGETTGCHKVKVKLMNEIRKSLINDMAPFWGTLKCKTNSQDFFFDLNDFEQFAD